MNIRPEALRQLMNDVQQDANLAVSLRVAPRQTFAKLPYLQPSERQALALQYQSNSDPLRSPNQGKKGPGGLPTQQHPTQPHLVPMHNPGVATILPRSGNNLNLFALGFLPWAAFIIKLGGANGPSVVDDISQVLANIDFGVGTPNKIYTFSTREWSSDYDVYYQTFGVFSPDSALSVMDMQEGVRQLNFFLDHDLCFYINMATIDTLANAYLMSAGKEIHGFYPHNIYIDTGAGTSQFDAFAVAIEGYYDAGPLVIWDPSTYVSGPAFLAYSEWYNKSGSVLQAAQSLPVINIFNVPSVGEVSKTVNIPFGPGGIPSIAQTVLDALPSSLPLGGIGNEPVNYTDASIAVEGVYFAGTII